MIENSRPPEPPQRISSAERVSPGATDIALLRITEGHSHEVVDSLAIEEPMEIRLLYNGHGRRQRKTVAITMRTPGNDVELALGFLFNEGILSCRNEFRVASHFGPLSAGGIRNLVHVELHDRVAVNLRSLERNFYTTSSCGVCGKTSIEEIPPAASVPPQEATLQIDSSLIHRLPELLREAQAVFASTGGLHAAALFDASGDLQTLREDVGRHNALDKLVGRQFLDGQLPAHRHLLVLSGRASFELMQKAARAGIPIVVAIGAPSSLAVSVARQQGITLIGFARADRFNVYSVPARVASPRTGVST